MLFERLQSQVIVFPPSFSSVTFLNGLHCYLEASIILPTLPDHSNPEIHRSCPFLCSCPIRPSDTIWHERLPVAIAFPGQIRSISSSCFTILLQLIVVQAVYIFIGVALLVGLAIGATLYYASAFLITLMNLESRPDEGPRGRTMPSYRARRRDKLQDKIRPPIMFPTVTSPKLDSTFNGNFAKLCEREPHSKTRSLLTSTILEEDGSTDVGS